METIINHYNQPQNIIHLAKYPSDKDILILNENGETIDIKGDWVDTTGHIICHKQNGNGVYKITTLLSLDLTSYVEFFSKLNIGDKILVLVEEANGDGTIFGLKKTFTYNGIQDRFNNTLNIIAVNTSTEIPIVTIPNLFN